MGKTQSNRYRMEEAYKELLKVAAREDKLIRAMREIKTALEHGEDPGDVIPWCLEHSKKAIKDYEGSGGIK